MRDFGVERRIVTADEVIALEPALAPHRAAIVGGDYTPEDESGDVHLFTAAVTREDFAGEQLVGLAERLTGGSFAPFLTHLLRSKKISRKELDRLRALLDGAGRGKA